MGDGTTNWTLGELAEMTGLSRRTIRYYISRGLLPGPLKAGRGSRYGAEHLERIRRIRELQERGMTLAEIALRLAGGRRSPLPDPVPWQVFELADDVVVRVRRDVPPWRLKQIRRGMEALMVHLESAGEDGEARVRRGRTGKERDR